MSDAAALRRNLKSKSDVQLPTPAHSNATDRNNTARQKKARERKQTEVTASLFIIMCNLTVQLKQPQPSVQVLAQKMNTPEIPN